MIIIIIMILNSLLRACLSIVHGCVPGSAKSRPALLPTVSTTIGDYMVRPSYPAYACAAQTRLAWETEVQARGDMAHLGVPAGAAVPCGVLKMNR